MATKTRLISALSKRVDPTGAQALLACVVTPNTEPAQNHGAAGDATCLPRVCVGLLMLPCSEIARLSGRRFHGRLMGIALDVSFAERHAVRSSDLAALDRGS